MFILKNAYISITRNKGRNILIGAIILVIACACTVTLAINNTAKDLINSYEGAYNKELSITFNRENMRKNFDFSNRDSLEEAKNSFNDIEAYTVDDIKSFATSDHIESYYYTYSISLNGNSIEKVEMENQNEMFNKDPGMGRGPNNNSLDFTLTGYNSLESMSEFIDGTYTMSEIKDDAWDIAFNGNYVFINEELATYNSLAVGDKINLQDENENIFEFEIIGIFKDNETDSETMSMFSNSSNNIITNSEALINITSNYENIKGNVHPTFIIDSYDNKDSIQQEFYDKGLNENYVVETNEEMATSGLQSVENVRSFAKTFLIITMIIGGVVLVVLNMINIRERKYEIGVFRTIGISKLKLTFQFVAELMMVSIVALIVGAGIGATMSKSVSNSLLSNEIESSTAQKEDMKNNFLGNRGGERMPDFGKINMGGGPNIQAYDSIDAVVNVEVLVQLLGIGLSLVFVSSLAAMISIQRFSPLTILKERS